MSKPMIDLEERQALEVNERLTQLEKDVLALSLIQEQIVATLKRLLGAN